MKFILLLKVCSALLMTCNPPIQHELLFSSWMECSKAGYLNGVKITNELGSQIVNDKKILVQFYCQPTTDDDA
jgi:hypothetical protein|tara:strand:- start:395 stop:613 length:219 start_codon:yes stop_codon:yes gene_type:complete